MKRKIIQIAIAIGPEEAGSNEWCLCDDGTVWEFTAATYEGWASLRERLGDKAGWNDRLIVKPAGWKRLPNVPQPDQE